MKLSRKPCNQNIINRLLLTSNTFNIKHKSKKKKEKYLFSKKAQIYLPPGKRELLDSRESLNEGLSGDELLANECIFIVNISFCTYSGGKKMQNTILISSTNYHRDTN